MTSEDTQAIANEVRKILLSDEFMRKFVDTYFETPIKEPKLEGIELGFPFSGKYVGSNVFTEITHPDNLSKESEKPNT
jgi:hypothetical protein